jgi:predicted outer membrane repeat protein
LEVPSGFFDSQNCGINVSADDTIIQSSHGSVVLNCNGTDRHFTIRGRNVTLSGFVLLNGSTPPNNCSNTDGECLDDLNGGCLQIFGNESLIRNSSLSNCAAAQNGGAINVVSNGRSIRLEHVSISHSKANNGAGVFSQGHVNLEDCDFSMNLANKDGGAIVIQGHGTSLRAANSVFISNKALAGNGGAIAAKLSPLPVSIACVTTPTETNLSVQLLDGVRFERNAADYGRGGAVFGQLSAAVLIHGGPAQAIFADNTASVGGALGLGAGSLNITGRVTFRGNAAVYASDGGAVHIRCGCQAIMSGDVTFVDNTASPSNWGFGGAVFASVVSLRVAGDVAFESNHAGYGMGGAIYVQFSDVVLAGRARFAGNDAYWGGALGVRSNPTFSLSGDVRVVGNQAPYGGAVYSEDSTELDVAGGVVFSLNQAEVGGAMMVTGVGRLGVGGRAAFANNSAEFGGAVTLVNYGGVVRAVASPTSYSPPCPLSASSLCAGLPNLRSVLRQQSRMRHDAVRITRRRSSPTTRCSWATRRSSAAPST